MEEVDHLADERSKAQFDVEAMKIVWLVHNNNSMSRNELLDLLRAILRFAKITERQQEASMLRFYVDEPAFTDLHWGMFIPAIKGQGTEQQQQKWLALAYKMQIIGCYAQTELGHGSNVQGLETTATFDPKYDEFIINSPTLTSSKWWPEGLVADIGMKFGNGAYNTMDNDVLRFDHVSIPRDQMLMRVSQVTRQQLYVRQTVVADVSCALSWAVCIATRYSAVQRQFGSQDGGLETQVIDYKTQQNRLFPLVNSAYDYSELPELFAVYVPACTYEGDNVVLLLQVARFLMKTVSQLGSGKQPVGTTAYMGRVKHLLQCCSDIQQAEDWLKPTAILEAFEARVARMFVACARNISKMPSQEEGFAELSSDLV
ncbi:hypothetical protein GIB67_018799 [Kingdonia uniflora]|uniref:Uncharacterized protein n=1 Tax=Kingdonia uniflora TaxID=39325 RepID=A0A7J7NDV7_9MAGN|nr:hypothetical protein GIB67_018799 [Kingdonia uniflora]